MGFRWVRVGLVLGLEVKLVGKTLGLDLGGFGAHLGPVLCLI